MALWTVELTKKRCFSCEVFCVEGGNSSNRKMYFDAKLNKDLAVKDRGLLKHGEVYVSESERNWWHRLPPEQKQDELVAQIEHYDEFEWHGEKQPHGFAIYTWLPTDSFRALLETNLETSSVYLTLHPIYVKDAFIPGDRPWSEPDAWDVEKANPLSVESITFEVRPREEQHVEEADADDSQEPEFAQLLRELGKIKALIEKTAVSTDKVYQCAFAIGIFIFAILLSIFFK